ncbi:hypothetical protein GW17_00024649 [Ensete ventricosum]|nr:hypothetical protein GW17_00024649 [Ensete ventricosum]
MVVQTAKEAREGSSVLQRRMGRGQRIGAAREKALGPTSGWRAIKRRRAIAVLQEGSGSSRWKSHRKQRRLEERATVVTDEGYDCGRDWEQKAGAVGEHRHDLVQAGREGREMAGMANGSDREDKNKGGRGTKRRSR